MFIAAMFAPPPTPPSWDGWHPILVHLPLGLFVVAPVLMLVAILAGKRAAGVRVSTLIVMIVGTIGAFLATSTGEAAADLVPETGAIGVTLERHEELAELARNAFAIITALYGVFTIATLVPVKKPLPGVAVAGVGIALLAATLAGNLLLANAAHAGGELVHVHGVKARLAASPATNATPTTADPAPVGDPAGEEEAEH